VIAIIRNRGIATLKGNHDEKVEKLTTTADTLNEPGKKYAYHLINDEGRAYLKTLPSHIRLEYKLNVDPLNLVLAHGSTRSIDEYVLVDTAEQYLLQMMEEADADLLFVGHSHKPFHRVLKTENGKTKHVINIGSVGKPKDGDPRGCYVLLTLNENSPVTEQESIEVSFIRFDYDIERAAMAIENSLLPVEFADLLRNGK
jgi:predicted phosphodiesterase